jgi:hypothetical protein
MTRIIIFIAVLTTGLSACSPTAKPAPPGMDILDAAYQGNLGVIQQHIQAGTDLNKRNDRGETALSSASSFGQTQVVKALIAAGADVNLQNVDGSTALHGAAFLCHTEVVEVLLDAGVDRNIRNNAGSTALDSVAGPFQDVKPIYELIESLLGPLGLKLDHEHLKVTRPIIAAMLR